MKDKIILIIIYIFFLFTNRHTFFKIIYTGLLLSNLYSIFKRKVKFNLKSLFQFFFIYFTSYFLIKDPNPFYYLVTFYLPMANLFRAIFIIIFITYFFNNFIIKDNDTNKKIEKINTKEEGDKKETNKEDKEIKEEKNNEEKKENNNDKKEEHNNGEIKENKNEEIKENNKEEKKENNTDDVKEKKENEKNKEKNNTFFLSKELKYLLDNKNQLLILLISLILLRLAIYFYDIKYWIEFIDKDALLSINNNNKNKDNNTIYYISAVIYNIEPIIKDWIDEMKKLIDFLGKENVIVSIYENGDSTDKTRKYLKFFENYLINHKVVNVINTEKIEEKNGMDRIRFLARLRNRSLDFLYRIADLDFSNTKIIFINDIIYRYEDIIKLIATNNGDYDAVCGMDYYESFYDTWASIGLDGKQFRRYFPYMYNKEQQDAYINGETIRTFSCWNGVTVIDAKPFEDRNKLFFRNGKKLRQSECTLLHADMYLMGYRKVFVNTEIVVAYTYEYYYKNHYLYPWTKNLFTYFYYYFTSGFVKRNYNLTNLVDSDISMDNNLEQDIIDYMGKY